MLREELNYIQLARREFIKVDYIKPIIKKVNEQGEFIKASIYVMVGFSIILVGYGIGRLVGMITF